MRALQGAPRQTKPANTQTPVTPVSGSGQKPVPSQPRFSDLSSRWLPLSPFYNICNKSHPLYLFNVAKRNTCSVPQGAGNSKYPCAEMFRCQNIPGPKCSGAENSSYLRTYVQWLWTCVLVDEWLTECPALRITTAKSNVPIQQCSASLVTGILKIQARLKVCDILPYWAINFEKDMIAFCLASLLKVTLWRKTPL